MKKIKVETEINAPLEKIWAGYNTPQDIEKWNSASPDWHTVNASSDFTVGGKFCSRMEAKDGSMGFDFAGVFTKIIPQQLVEYDFGERHAKVEFLQKPHSVIVRVEFDPEDEFPIEQQQMGWQAILNNFKAYIEQ